MQVTDACAPHITASSFSTCRRHKRDLDQVGYRRPTVHRVRVTEAVELIACHIFHMADRDHQRVSMEMVRTRLDRLREHPPGCCQLCRAAAMVAPADVYRIAKQWEWQTTASRLRTLR